MTQKAPASLTDMQQAALDALLADAVRQKKLDRVSVCIEKGARFDSVVRDVNQYGQVSHWPLAIYAARHFNKDVYECLVRNGMPIDAQDDQGDTALMIAVTDKSVEKVKALVALGASPLHMNRARDVVLAAARSLTSGNEREQIIDLLLAALPRVREPFNKAAEAEPPKAIDKPLPAIKSIVFNDDAPDSPVQARKDSGFTPPDARK